MSLCYKRHEKQEETGRKEKREGGREDQEDVYVFFWTQRLPNMTHTHTEGRSLLQTPKLQESTSFFSLLEVSEEKKMDRQYNDSVCWGTEMERVTLTLSDERDNNDSLGLTGEDTRRRCWCRQSFLHVICSRLSCDDGLLFFSGLPTKEVWSFPPLGFASFASLLE